MSYLCSLAPNKATSGWHRAGTQEGWIVTEPLASYRCPSNGELVTDVRKNAIGHIVTTQRGNIVKTYYGVQRLEVGVGDVLEEPLRHRWHSIRMDWTPWDSSECDADD